MRAHIPKPKFPELKNLDKTHPKKMSISGAGLSITSHNRPSKKFKGNIEQVNVLHDEKSGKELAAIVHRSNGSVDIWVAENAKGELEYDGARITPGGYKRHSVQDRVMYRNRIDVIEPRLDAEKKHGGGIRFDFLRYADRTKETIPKGPRGHYKGEKLAYAWHPR